MAKRSTKRPTKSQPFTIEGVLDWILDLRFFHSDDAIDGRVAIPFYYNAGAENARLVLVLGENAGGKSFFRRLVQEACRHKGNNSGPYPVREVIYLSMEHRTGGMMGPIGAFVYGSEQRRSTGENSAHTVEGGITTASGRNHDVVVYWDEPDIGMSAACAIGVGVEIAQFVNEAPDNIKAVFVTTHSPAMVTALLKADARPHYLYLGDEMAPLSLEDWVAWQADVALHGPGISPKQLAEASHKRFKDIQAILDDKGRK